MTIQPSLEIQDKCGQPITTGSYIVYGHALGRCAALRIGKVLDIKERRKNFVNDPGISITVMGVNDDRDWRSGSPKLCSKKGTLMYPDRVIVLKKSMMPKTHLQLLKNL